MGNNHITNPRKTDGITVECIKCREWKSKSEFHKDSTSKFGVAYYCKSCACTSSRSHYKKRKDLPEVRKAARDSYCKNKYGISLEQYQERLAAQNNECVICRVKLLASGSGTHLDHSHKTGKLRAFLCTNCNRGLGHFKDNPELLSKAAEYLDTHNKSVDLEKEATSMIALIDG